LQDVTSALPVRQRRRLSLTAPSGSALPDSHHVVAPHLLPTMGTSADSIAGSSVSAQADAQRCYEIWLGKRPVGNLHFFSYVGTVDCN
jgi:hypothetical protein